MLNLTYRFCLDSFKVEQWKKVEQWMKVEQWICAIKWFDMCNNMVLLPKDAALIWGTAFIRENMVFQIYKLLKVLAKVVT